METNHTHDPTRAAPRLAACVPTVMPEYMQSLTALQRILDFQESLAARVQSGLHLDRASARQKWQAGKPLFSGETISLSPDLLYSACQELERLLPAESDVQEACGRLLASPQWAGAALPAFLDDFMTDRAQAIRRLARTLPADAATLSSLLQVLLSPFFVREASPYQDWIDPALWRRGFCPICGSPPGMARLESEQGGRLLACSLCRSEWSYDRLHCPFCEGDSQPRLRYFTVGGDEVHRVECCDRCHSYLKTVDERVLAHRADLLVEDMITSHLDIAAREQGYH